MDDPNHIPVIVGVGQVNDRTDDPDVAMNPIDLMAAALRAADSDGGGGWLPALDSLAVVHQISFPEINPLVDAVAAALGITPAHRFQTAKAMGDSPVRLLNEAANRIGAGDSVIAAVVGGEALRTAMRRAATRGEADHNAIRARHRGISPSYRMRYGLTAPVDLYPLYENATRSAWGQTLDDGQAENGLIWALLSHVAATNPDAWLRIPRTADEIIVPSASNRSIAFPYTKLMVANIAVNQGAGFIVTSLAEARARGVPEARIIHIGHGAAAHEPEDILARDSYAHSVSMQVSLEQTLIANGLTIDDIDLVELYSCFPCIPKMARRIIGLPASHTASVVGGLTFGGGPIGNYMSHAIAAMVGRLREGGKRGLLFGNGGSATHNHSIILSSDALQGTRFPQDFDRQAMADAMRGPSPDIAEDYQGVATIESYTVLYNRGGAPSAGAIVARTPTGDRFLAHVPPDDTATIAFLTNGNSDPVGSTGTAHRQADGLTHWRPAG